MTPGNAFFSYAARQLRHSTPTGDLSDNDQRHRLVLSGAIEAPVSVTCRCAARFQLAWVFTYGSPQPFNVVTGGDRNNDTNVNDRPVGVGRNTGEGFDYHSLDLRLGYRFRMAGVSVEASLDAFNVLNQTNLLFPNNTFGQGLTPLPAFGLATAAADPRQLQLGVRLRF